MFVVKMQYLMAFKNEVLHVQFVYRVCKAK